MHVGTGHRYLLRSVARGDAESLNVAPLSRYYAESGTPPGRFLGAGLAGLADGAGIAAGSAVDEQMLRRLHAHLQDPMTGAPLGTLPRRPSTRDQRTVARTVAGFDLTCSVPKSVSAVWALADEPTRAEIYRTHQDAIAAVLGWAEQQVFCSRSGPDSTVQEPIRGVVATGFDHWDSRTVDPHLHTHVVVANRAQRVRDAQWRALDSRRLFKYVVTLSALHTGVVQDLLSDRLGFAWEERARRHDARPGPDIAGVPAELIEAFSRRSVQIDNITNELVSAFATRRGRQPGLDELPRLRQQATLQARPAKRPRSLAERSDEWRARAAQIVGADTAGWVDSLRDRTTSPALSSADVEAGLARDAGVRALRTVASRRSTFSHANLLAEVHRQLHGVRFGTAADRLAVADRTATSALGDAVRLSVIRGEAITRRRNTERYTTREILAAETRLRQATRDTSGPAVPDAVAPSIVGSGRVLDTLAEPAGPGRTATLDGVRAAWERHHGPDSVIGLAPSAAAAQALSDKVGIGTHTIGNWLADIETHRDLRDDQAVRRGQLVIIDDAALASTLNIDEVVRRTREAGGKVLLVGDRSGLGRIEAGAAFAKLVDDRSAARLRDTPAHGTADITARIARMRGVAAAAVAFERPGPWTPYPDAARMPQEIGL